jgi:hypothetical protein
MAGTTQESAEAAAVVGFVPGLGSLIHRLRMRGAAMTRPVIPLLSAEASGWYYRLRADEQRRHADVLATALSCQLYGTTPDRLDVLAVRLILARVRQRFAA